MKKKYSLKPQLKSSQQVEDAKRELAEYNKDYIKYMGDPDGVACENIIKSVRRLIKRA